MSVDYLGDPLPAGYRPWICDHCTAVCTFEAMMQCHRQPDCPYDRDKVQANGGAFGLMVPDHVPDPPHGR